MFSLARLLFIVVYAGSLYCLFVVNLVYWPWPFLAFGGLVALDRRFRGRQLWAHGTAEWSSEFALRKAGMIGGKKGLAIGRASDTPAEPFSKAIHSLIDPRVTSEDACQRLMVRLAQMLGPKRGEIVRLAKAVHVAVFGPTGVGKGASFIIPWLQEVDESAVVLDYKGENARLTAQHREKKFGHRIVLLDPFKVVTNRPDCFNPVDFIEQGSANALDDCRDLAEQLVVRNGAAEREPHWNEAAEMWIGAALVAVVENAANDNRSLQTVRNILSNPDKIPQLLQLLCQTEGMVSRLGGQLAHFRDKELSSTLTTANRHLRFLDTQAVAASTACSSFDPRELREGKMTVYCILPPEHMRAQAALIRMWVGSLMRAVVQGGLQRG